MVTTQPTPRRCLVCRRCSGNTGGMGVRCVYSACRPQACWLVSKAAVLIVLGRPGGRRAEQGVRGQSSTRRPRAETHRTLGASDPPRRGVVVGSRWPGGRLRWKPFGLPGVGSVCARQAEPGEGRTRLGRTRAWSPVEAFVGSARTSCLYGAVSGPSPEVADGLLSILSAHAPGRASSPAVDSSPGARCGLWSAAACPFQGPEPPAAPRAGPCAPGRQHRPERGACPQAGLAAETQLPGAACGPAAALQYLQVPGTVSDSLAAQP